MRVNLAMVFFVLTILPGSASVAQSPNGSIAGIVLDPDAKAVPGAEIIVVNDLTGVKYVSSTNGEGVYTVANLPPGPYRVQVSKMGFKAVVKPDIILNVQDALSLNFTLPIGAESITVTVEGGAPLINTQNAAVGTVVDRNFVENMPLNGRSFQDLILLTPGVVQASPQVGGVLGSSGEFSVNGQRTESNYYTVDGVSANVGVYPGDVTYAGSSGSVSAATALGTTQGLISVDALQEFRVQSSSYSAEYGRNPGGQFSFVTRSGTNQLHGSAFDYLRNDFFDANDWFNDYYRRPHSALRQNDFGGTLGGPVDFPRLYNGKGKTFFLVSYEGLRLLQPQAAKALSVPDAYLRTCSTHSIQQVLNAFPQATTPSPAPNCASADPGSGTAQFIGAWSNPSSIDAVSVRLDQAIGSKYRAFFRFGGTSSTSAPRNTRSGSEVDSLSYTARTYTGGLTAALSSRVSNEFRINYSSNRGMLSEQIESFGGGVAIDLAQLQGINTTGSRAYGMSFFMSFGSRPLLNQGETNTLQRQWNFVDTTSLSIGRHQVMLGADYRRLAPEISRQNPFVDYQYFSANSVLANAADSSSAQNVGGAYPLYQNLSLFVQDDWRWKPRLTIFLGLRWEVNPAPGVTRGVKPYTVRGLNDLSTATLAPEGAELWATTWYNFAPRLGAAYILRPMPGFETVMRGGAGIFYDTAQQTGSAGFLGPGFYATNSASRAAFPYTPYAVGPVITNPPTPPYGAVRAYAAHLQLPYTLETNFSLEQALGKAQKLTVSYVGAFGRKLLENRSLNLRPINPNMSPLILSSNGLTSDYNALQAQYQRRLSAGLQALASYTWSNCFDYGSSNIDYPSRRGNCASDVRHNFSAAVSYELPNVVGNKSRLGGALLNHWAFDDRFTVRSAFPVTLQGPCAFVAATEQYQCLGLDVVAGQPIYVTGTQCSSILGVSCPGGRAVNPNAFRLPQGCISVFFCPSPAAPGDAPRNFVRGFGAWQMDFAVRREFPIHERLKLQFRAEAFNIFNHPNFGAIDSSYGDSTFGLATATLAHSLGVLSDLYQTGGPRSLQFALQVVF